MPRGRRVNSSGEKSKQLLLEKSIELFSAKGYHQTKISDIVKAANLTQPTFYLYFQSKSALFNDLNQQFQHEIKEIFSKTQHNNAEANLTYIFEYFFENPELTKIGLYESEQAMEVKELLLTEIKHTLQKQYTDFDTLQNVNANIVAESLLGSIERLTLTTLLANKTTPERLASDLVNIYFAEQRKLVR